MRKSWLALQVMLLAIIALPMTAGAQTLKTVPYVDLKKYAGKWYEIASYPQRFQKNCTCTVANYTPTAKGYVEVRNQCNKDSINGKISAITGKAIVQPNSGNAKLKVQFFWPFKGDYWILGLAKDYSYAVVSNPSYKYLWILSRTPKMSATVYRDILAMLKQKGFDLNRLKLTKQAG